MNDKLIKHSLKKRKCDSSSSETLKKSSRHDDKYYLNKLSPTEVTQILKESTTEEESSSFESDNESNDFWAVSKSPLNKSFNQRSNGSKDGDKNPNVLVVSPVKLKRKSDFTKIKSLSKDESSLIDLEITRKIESLSRENQPSICATETVTKNATLYDENCVMPSNITNGGKILKNKLLDSDSEPSSASFENFKSIENCARKTPKKISKTEVSNKILRVVLNRVEPEALEKLGIKDELKPVKSCNKSSVPESENRKSSKVNDHDLAFPLNLLDTDCKSFHTSLKELRNEEFKENIRVSECTSDSFASDAADSLKSFQSESSLLRTKKNSKTDQSTPHLTRRSRRIKNDKTEVRNKTRCSSREASKLKHYKEIDSNSENDYLESSPEKLKVDITKYESPKAFFEFQRSAKKGTRIRNPVKKVDHKDVSLSSSDESDTESNQNLTPSHSGLRIKKVNENKSSEIKQTPRSSSVSKNDLSTEELEMAVTRTSQRISSRRNNSVDQISKVKNETKSNLEPSSSPGRISLRKRSEIKRPCYEDYETEFKSGRRNSNASPKTASLIKDSKVVEASSEKSIPQSQRHSKRLFQKESNKKEIESKESCGDICDTPRSSSRNQNLSPLVNSVDRISLRNRSDIKKKLGDEFELDLGKRLSIVNSPKTPSQSLRKQVLESTTRSAKKKLVLGSESSSDSDEDFKPLRRTPRKKRADSTDQTSPFKTPTKSVSKTPNKTPSKCTPKRRNEPSTPCTPSTVRRVGQGFLTPVVEERFLKRHSMSKIEDLRIKLHVSTVPSSLPCRFNESKNIKSFILCKMKDKTGGCMYISGVPGTGKTATVHAAIKVLQQEAIDRKVSPFDFVEVNGLRLSEAKQAYVRIWLSISGTKASVDQSLHFLEKKFSGKPSRTTVLLIDELDYVCNRRQDVIYNILDWSTKKNSRLIVLTIANTMDLPERTLKGRVTSRMGLTRLVFQPYSFQQLQEIVMDRIDGSSSFDPDAVQFVARKVAAVSGDARRALDICRRATELLEPDENQVTLEHVDKTLSQIYLSRRVQAIKHCSYMGQLLLRSLRDESLRTGVEESNVRDVYSHLCSLCNLEGSWLPTLGQVLSLCRTLSSSGILSMEKGRNDILTKLTLNVSSDDIHYALSC